eukprot:CAMPEP_0194295890 /NCGR_PEP_ID=MMETSP0169-20130528/54644_1 /TAXON_ID=218684 /ORGANISM="Corethron pennatum, Strain L29A3" /LENGTH=203 /DNA_ID=CAMNT_0039045179 /DNA_START=107 /DNA_END=718 /DNA_ORIENTATION=-
MRNVRLLKGRYGKGLLFHHSRKNLLQSPTSESTFLDDLPQSPEYDLIFHCSVMKDEKGVNSLSSSLRNRIHFKVQKPNWLLKFEKRKLGKKRKLESALQLQNSIRTNGKDRRKVFRSSRYDDPEPFNGYSGLVFVRQQNVYNMGPIKEPVSIICEKIDSENGDGGTKDSYHPVGNQIIELFDDKRLDIGTSDCVMKLRFLAVS